MDGGATTGGPEAWSETGGAAETAEVQKNREDQHANSGQTKDPPSHLDKDGRPLYLAENMKGITGQNQWMWLNAKLIFGDRNETKSSKCLGAYCLKCEEMGKSTKDCYLNYHPTRNFKAISRHFKRLHPDLNSDTGPTESSRKNAPESKRSVESINLTSNRSPSAMRKSKRAKTAVDSSTGAKEAIPRGHMSLDKKASGEHRIICAPTFHACGEGRLIVVTEHMLSVPLYRTRTKPGVIDIYFTITEKINPTRASFFEDLAPLSQVQRAAEYVDDAGLANADHMLLFLQGGPGFGAPIPNVSLGLASESSWMAKALNQYSRVVLMDQRGTGRSCPVTKQSLERLFPDLFLLDHVVNKFSPSLDELHESHPEEVQKVKEAAGDVSDLFTQFRAESIVRDAEDVKDALLLQASKKGSSRPWGCALGQSFGGFCIMTYLSQIAHPPRVCLFTGGIAPMLTSSYDAYRSLWGRVKERSLRYYEMYPGDITIVKAIVKALLDEPAPLPSGGLLTARRFLQLGLDLGGSPSSFARFHSLLSGAFLDTAEEDGELDFKRSFLKSMDSAQSFDDHPFFFWMHECIYADGPENSPTNWAAHRAYEDILKEGKKEFDYQYTSSLDDDSQPTLFFGEMMFPWMPQDYEELSGVGLQAVASDLAAKTDWGKLYDAESMRKVLSDGTCKAAAAVYHQDMYVDFGACMKVTARGGPLEKCKVWVTNEYQHSGVRDDGARIFGKLHNMALGSLRVPS